MKDYSKVRKKMRQMYAAGKSIDEIAVLFDLQPASVQYHRRIDARNGADWDALRVECRVGETATEEAHQQFLGTLFGCFAEELPKLREITDAAKRLDILRTYSRTYSELIRAVRTDPRIDVGEVVAKTLDLLVDQAIEDGRDDLALWLQASLDAIRDKVRKEFA
ncbi:DUF1804 family protein [Megalodesulfovibrio gigas]|uniref:Putative helix-turn-helix domain of resolvase protein n=1 Tax=Megalodesulfovibrio gigas (strain ATCC 19364 / DSM 1382 / NCIMB 9332 / VKM B-1759) TaxID=1121448 RepID=T2GE19_MEGG1|nr:DUF1804 family protein [Megalodesulfovibrio gigas]AGW14132.1 putative helix-turn-helix domain of resolvase protein [Megalodesulfovibrio gigas DSM 1382 = ATCC 19364]